jgi:hypothetical protein
MHLMCTEQQIKYVRKVPQRVIVCQPLSARSAIFLQMSLRV